MAASKRVADQYSDSDEEVSPPPRKRGKHPSNASAELPSFGPIYSSDGKSDLLIKSAYHKQKRLLPADHYIVEVKGLLLGDEIESDDAEPTPAAANSELLSDDDTLEGEEGVAPGATHEKGATPGATLPVRLLKWFTVIDYHEDEAEQYATSLDVLTDNSMNDSAPHFIGFVYPKQEEGEEDHLDESDEETETDNDGVYMLSSVILRFQLDANPLKPMLWLQTQYAWYICDNPSAFYHTEYIQFWEPRYLARLVMTSESKNFSEHFDVDIRDVDQVEFGGAVGVMGWSYTDAQIQASKRMSEQARNAIEDLLHDVEADIEVCEEIVEEAYGSRARSRIKQQLGDHPYRPPPKVRKQAHPPSKTFMTPAVQAVAYATWIRNNSIVSTDAAGITCNPDTVLSESLSFSFGQSDGQPWALDNDVDESVETILQGQPREVDAYLTTSNLDMDLSAGEFVAVRGEQRGKQELWFGRLVYFFEAEDKDGPDTWAHIRWLKHMSQSSLGSAAHPRELYVMNECDNIPLSSVAGKINVTKLEFKEGEPDYSRKDKDHFFVRYFCETIQGQTSFEDADKYGFDNIETPVDPGDEPLPFLGCWTCQYRTSLQFAGTPQLSEGRQVLDLGGIRYHRFDFVFLEPSEERKPHLVGQIEEFKADRNRINIKVRLFDRKCAHGQRNQEPYEQYELCVSAERRTVDSECLQGLCSVLGSKDIPDLADWTSRNRHFYFEATSSDRYRYCTDKDCVKKRNANPKSCNPPPLVRKRAVLDWFHGAGGLSLGLEQVGCFDVRWGVDHSLSASDTFRANHPGAVSVNADANTVLRNVVHGSSGRWTNPYDALQRNLGLPEPGEVDVLVTGPPCQGFSLMNTHRSPDDIKNTLVANALSAVDHFQPDYVILENVSSLVSLLTKKFNAGAGKEGKHMEAAAARKFIERGMMRLGYQGRWSILQASQYGVPQTRKRFIFFGARRGLELPHLPIPTHTPALNAQTKTKQTTAPLPCVTIGDAIGDLPPFHWLNPKERYPMAQTMGGNSYDAVSTKGRIEATGPTHATYASNAFTSYQAECRGAQTTTQLHKTRTFPAIVVERICNVPLRPGAGHHDLPHGLSVPHMSVSYTRGYRFTGEGKGKYARGSKDEAAGTVVTNPHPESIQGRVLHPNQNRIFTARENARLQGFPDSYKLNGSIQEIYRLIGNAVPVPLARALGFELRKCFKD